VHTSTGAGATSECMSDYSTRRIRIEKRNFPMAGRASEQILGVLDLQTRYCTAIQESRIQRICISTIPSSRSCKVLWGKGALLDQSSPPAEAVAAGAASGIIMRRT
jgi:hypothetical protein